MSSKTKKKNCLIFNIKVISLNICIDLYRQTIKDRLNRARGENTLSCSIAKDWAKWFGF